MPSKAALLDEAVRQGLPVPAGFVVTDGAPPTAAAPLVTAGRRHAVRSAFGLEDGTEESLAGWFDTELDVEAPDVPAAIERIRRSADRQPGDFRTDVLVMEMVDARHAGVAFSEPGTYDDIVNETSGTAASMVAGEVPGRRVLLARIESARTGWQRRLQALLAQLRSAFGDEPWDVEWADDGERCWLVQLRPITAPPVRHEHLTLANHAEILPALPSTFMTSLIAEAGPDLFEWYRRADPTLPTDREFLQVRAGRPLINLSLLEDMMRHFGLPTGLVADSIGGDAVERRPPNPRRLLTKLPPLVRLGLATARATARSQRIRSELIAGAAGSDSFSQAIDALHATYVGLVTGMFPLSSAIGPPLAVLRRLGVLVEHSARHRTITTELADALAGLGSASEDRTDHDAVDRFIEAFGHRGVYESDIARPRYREMRDQLGRTPPAAVGQLAGRTVRGRLTTPLWAIARRPIEAREHLRHDGMKAFDVIRRDLLRLAADAVDRDQLPTPEHLWLLEVDEARRLDEGWMPDRGFWHSRLDQREREATIDVPVLVDSAVDPRSWNHAPLAEGELSGLSLTTGIVEGAAWVLAEPSSAPPDLDRQGPVVLVARSIDAGWITTMAHCDAVVVEIGGDLSHGSILIRERGLPAVTNVAGATRAITTGQPITVDAGRGVVTPG